MPPHLVEHSTRFADMMGRLGLFAYLATFLGLCACSAIDASSKLEADKKWWLDRVERWVVAPFATLALIHTPYWIAVGLQNYGDYLLQLIDGQAAVPTGIVLALGFYWLRVHQPFAYGVIELVVAAVVILASGNAPPDNLLAKGLGFLGGVYVFVRGLDNMSKRLPASWRARWARYFGP